MPYAFAVGDRRLYKTNTNRSQMHEWKRFGANRSSVRIRTHYCSDHKLIAKRAIHNEKPYKAQTCFCVICGTTNIDWQFFSKSERLFYARSGVF